MRIAAVKALYFTGAGTTRLVAERLAERCGLPAEMADVTPRGAVPPAFGEHDLAVFAVPSYGGRVPVPMLERIARCEGRDTPAVLLVTYGNRAIDDTLLELADAVRERGFVPVGAAAVVAHHSLMTNVAEGRPDEKDLAVVDELARVALARLFATPDARTCPGAVPTGSSAASRSIPRRTRPAASPAGRAPGSAPRAPSTRMSPRGRRSVAASPASAAWRRVRRVLDG